MVKGFSEPAFAAAEAFAAYPECGWVGQSRRPLHSLVQAPEQNEVHLWLTRLDVAAAASERYASVLSQMELDRASRFRLPVHERRYVAAHGCLRFVLASYLEVSPNAVEFDFGPRGKPELRSSNNPAGLRFNLAHSEDFAAIAIAAGCEVGVDVERIRPIPDAETLVNRFFSPNESKHFRRLPEGSREEAFFNLWTRKEAWLKATGEGIGHLLNQVEVSFTPGELAKLRKLPEDYAEGQPWSLRHVSPEPGVVIAVAARCDSLELRSFWADRVWEQCL